MSRRIQRVTDVNSEGGAITSSPQNSVFIDGLPVAVEGSPVAPHPHKHNAQQTTSSGANVFINGIRVTLEGDLDTCGHPRVGGAGNVGIG